MERQAAATASIDETQLFYLMARGVPRAEAERLTRERRPDLWAAYLARQKPKNGPKSRG